VICFEKRCYSTYEELKPGIAELFKNQMYWCYSTYEELKLCYYFNCRVPAWSMLFYLWGIETTQYVCVVAQLHRCYSTYEELKLVLEHDITKRLAGCYSTYEELKLGANIYSPSSQLPMLFYLWGIETAQSKFLVQITKAMLFYLWGIETEYIAFVEFTAHLDAILPMRNWNWSGKHPKPTG